MKKIIIIIIVLFAAINNINCQYSPILKYDRVNGYLIGYIDSTGKIIIEPTKYVGDVENTNFKFLDKIINDFRLPSWALFNNNYVTIKEAHNYMLSKRYTYMVLDKNLDTIFAPQEDLIYGINDGIGILKHYLKNAQSIYDSICYFIRLDSVLLTDENYSYITPFSNGYALVSQSENADEDYNYFFIDRNGEKVNKDLIFKDALPFRNGYSAVRFDSCWYIIDTNFAELDTKNLNCYRYKQINLFSSAGIARFMDLNSDGKVIYGFVSKDGVLGDNYDYVGNFSDGLALVKKNSHFGYIDVKGELVITYKYLYANDFSNGLAAVYDNGGWCYIDNSGNIKIDGKYDYAWTFSNGLAKVQKNNKIMYINKTGKIIYEFE